MDNRNLAIIRQSFASAVFTHKVQELAAERCARKATVINIFNLILVSSILVSLALQIIYNHCIILSYVSLGITILEIICLIIKLSFNFEERIILHKNSALKYMGLRDQYKLLIVDIMNDNISEKDIKQRRNLLQREYQVISDLSPQTVVKDYKEAQKRLNKRGDVQGEDFTWHEDEIDRFLPNQLKLTNE